MLKRAPTQGRKTPERESEARLLPAYIEQGRADVSQMRNALPAATQTRTTKEEYAKRVDRLASGLDIAAACSDMSPNELGLWKAAAKWEAARKVRQAMRETDEAKKGRRVVEKMTNGVERVVVVPHASNAERWKAEGAATEKVRQAFAEFRRTCAEVEGWRRTKTVKKEAEHKKRPLRPQQMAKLFEAIPQGSFIRDACLVASFCGARPQEFAGGVVVEAMRDEKGRTGLKFSILERAKGDGEKKGLETGEIFIPVASLTDKATIGRFKELADKVSTAKRLVVKVAPTARQTVGQRLTQAIRPFTKGLSFDASFYSFRQTFSAAAKASAAARGLSKASAAVEVADMLGHQATRTQKFYGRSDRGRGGFSPESARLPDPSIRLNSTGMGSTPKATAAAQKSAISAGMSPPTMKPKGPRRL